MKNSLVFCASIWGAIETYDRVTSDGWGAFGFVILACLTFGCIGLGVARVDSEPETRKINLREGK